MNIDPRHKQWLLSEKYNGNETADFFHDVARLSQGEPIDLVIGFTPFLGNKIYLDSGPLIPRSETEYWVEKTFADIQKTKGKDPFSFLDIFAGSGCIGIAILSHFPHASGTFAEIDTAHTNQIKKNLQANNIPLERATIYQSNVFSSLPNNKFDFIFANPPYVSLQRARHVQESVKHWEPAEAVFAPQNGLRYIEEFLDGLESFLEHPGTAYVEHDDWQENILRNMMGAHSHLQGEFWKDQYGRTRVLKITTTGT